MTRACLDCGAHIVDSWNGGDCGGVTYACGTIHDVPADGGPELYHRALPCHLRELRQVLGAAGATLLVEADRTLRGIARAITNRNRP